MLFSTLVNALPAALLLSGARGSPVNDYAKKPRQTSLETFIKNQAEISIKGVIANIGGGGSKAQGVSAGIVVASPSKSNPDCKQTLSPSHVLRLMTPQTGIPGLVTRL